MSIPSELFLSFMRCYLSSFSFFSAGHLSLSYLIIFIKYTKNLKKSQYSQKISLSMQRFDKFTSLARGEARLFLGVNFCNKNLRPRCHLDILNSFANFKTAYHPKRADKRFSKSTDTAYKC